MTNSPSPPLRLRAPDSFHRSNQLVLRGCKVCRYVLRDLARLCVGLESVPTYFGDSVGDDNLAIMIDLSNFSDMIALEGLLEELLKETLRPHYYRVMEQDVIMLKKSVIDELRMYALPKHSKSIASAISGLLNFVDDQISRNKSVDPIPIIQKSAIENPTNNPCKDF